MLNTFRPTREASRRAHSTRHMVRSMSPLLPGEKKPYSSACAAGYTYSGVGALKLLGKLPRQKTDSQREGSMSPEFVENVTKWLVSRQTLMLHESDELPLPDDELPASMADFSPPTHHVQGTFSASSADAGLPHTSVETSPHNLQWAGFNGRCSKVADTCYAFWVGGTLGVSSRYSRSLSVWLTSGRCRC